MNDECNESENVLRERETSTVLFGWRGHLCVAWTLVKLTLCQSSSESSMRNLGKR